MNKKQKEKNTETMRQCLNDCGMFMEDMNTIDIQSAGFSFRNTLGLEIESDEDGAISKENIMKALEGKIEEGISGTNSDFSETYSTMLFAVRMLYAIYEHTRLLEWYAKKTQETQGVE